jgi:V/A-type H+-transporting ATPase subunit A
MMRQIGRFIDLAERALAAGAHPERIARLDCVRPLQRMGEEIGDGELDRFAVLEAAMEREFTDLLQVSEGAHAAHG